MRFHTLLVLIAIGAAPAFGSNLQSKQMRASAVMKLSHADQTMAILRDLKYEEANLSMDERVQSELSLFVSNIQKSVLDAYEAELIETAGDSEAAKSRIISFAEKDLAFADENVAKDVRSITVETLKNIDSGGVSDHSKSVEIEKMLKIKVQERMTLLTVKEECCDPIQPKVNPSKDADKKSYESIDELIESLVSDRESSKWVSASNQSIKTGQAYSNDGKIGVSVKIPFLGVSGDIGATVTFKRETNTGATVTAEGLYPVLKADGNFDIFKRDKLGNVITVNGVNQKRYISFTCDAERTFTNEFSTGGGLSIGVSGLSINGEKTWSKVYTGSVNMTSRRITLPEFVDGKGVTVKLLAEVCHKHFLKGKFSNSLTVKKSLDIMMSNVIAGLEFSHTKTKCAVERQCYDWYSTKVIGMLRMNNWPRCEVEREGYLNCKLKGLSGQNCPVIENGKRVSNGQFEFSCDKGLKCTKVKNVTFSSNSVEEFIFGEIRQYAKGLCRPINKKDYQKPRPDFN